MGEHQFVVIGRVRIDIEEGYYKKEDFLKEIVTKAIKKKCGTGLGSQVEFKSERSGKTSIRNPERATILIRDTLAEMLGFNMDRHPTRPFGPWKQLEVKDRTVESEFPIDLNQGVHQLYVYCDIVKPHIVGDVKVRLLRIVPREEGKLVVKDYNPIQYFPVLTNKFNTIEINIKDDRNELIRFNRGKVIATLHFRKTV